MKSARTRLLELLAAACVALLLGSLYARLRQINLPEDAPVFLDLFEPSPPAFHPHHPLFGRLLHAAIRIGARFGFDPATAGATQSAIFAALACGALVPLARARGISRGAATLFALLLGLSGTLLVNATTVELYAASLFAVVLNLAAFGAAARRIPRGARTRILAEAPARLAFAATAALVVSLHVGFGPWALAGWLALASLDRGLARRALRLAEGAVVLALLLGWIALEAPPREAVLADARSLAKEFGRFPEWTDLLRLPLLAPLFAFSMHAGLVLFPATLGTRRSRSPGIESDLAPERRLALFAFPLFFAVYSFWTIDEGSFFVPLLPLAAIFAARGWDRIARAGPRARILGLGALCVHAALFVILPRSERFVIAPESFLACAFAASFILWMAAWIVLGRRIADADDTPDSHPDAAPTPDAPAGLLRRPLAFPLAALLAILLQLAAAAPRLASFREPDLATLAMREFDAIAPPGARLVANLPQRRPRRQTRHPVLPSLDGWFDADLMTSRRETLGGWLQETVGPRGTPLYLDEASRRSIDFLWGRFGEPPWISIAYESFQFHPVVSGGSLFHRLEWNPLRAPRDAARRFDLHPPERWGPDAVRWTRRTALLDVERGSRLRVRYWVGHGRIGPEDPVVVTIGLDGATEPLARREHLAAEMGEAILEIPDRAPGNSAPSPPARLRIDVEPFWISPDGRELGIALYDIERLDAGAGPR